MAKIEEILGGTYYMDKNNTIHFKKGKGFTSKYTKFLPYCQLKSHFKLLEEQSREQINRAIVAGFDPDYIMKSSKELNGKEPSFEWQKGCLVFVKKKKTA